MWTILEFKRSNLAELGVAVNSTGMIVVRWWYDDSDPDLATWRIEVTIRNGDAMEEAFRTQDGGDVRQQAPRTRRELYRRLLRMGVLTPDQVRGIDEDEALIPEAIRGLSWGISTTWIMAGSEEAAEALIKEIDG